MQRAKDQKQEIIWRGVAKTKAVGRFWRGEDLGRGSKGLEKAISWGGICGDGLELANASRGSHEIMGGGLGRESIFSETSEKIEKIIWRGVAKKFNSGGKEWERGRSGNLLGVAVAESGLAGQTPRRGSQQIQGEESGKKEIIWRGVAKLKGFTLVELLVVFAIIVILIGITFGFVSKMKARNQAVVCELNLKTIGQALRMYRLDEGAYPPFDPVDKPNDPGFGLWALFDQGYIHSPRVLHCSQADATRKPQPYVRFDPLFPYKRQNGYNSYQDVEDPDTGEWRYLPYRGVPYDPSNPPVPGSDVYRQLEAYDTVGNKISNWHPQDNTIVTWCPFHRRVIKKAGVPQDIVLFLDGTVQRLDAPVSWTTLPKE